jgi:nucleotide-binding universal stress UspA family protein
MEGIVVGVDESPNAAQALRWAVEHGAVRHQPVTAVMAWGYLAQHHAEASQPFDPQYTEADAEEALTELVRRTVGLDAGVGRKLVCDLAPRALLEATRDAALLVVGARGVGGFEGLLLGSVSRQVLHHASCPVVVVRASAHPPATRRIIVGVDGSGPARAALRWAIDEGSARQLPVVALHAWRYPYVSNGLFVPVVDVDLLEKCAAELLDHEIDAVDASRLASPIQRRVEPAPAAAAIMAAAGEDAIVVVGSRGLGGFKGLLFGSVSDQLTLHAPCPVVVLPATSS